MQKTLLFELGHGQLGEIYLRGAVGWVLEDRRGTAMARSRNAHDQQPTPFFTRS